MCKFFLQVLVQLKNQKWFLHGKDFFAMATLDGRNSGPNGSIVSILAVVNRVSSGVSMGPKAGPYLNIFFPENSMLSEIFVCGNLASRAAERGLADACASVGTE